MKRCLSLILAAVLVFSLWSCTDSGEEQFQDPVKFYFLRNETKTGNHGGENSVFVPELREGDGLRSNLSMLLNLYLSDPGSEECRSPFPKGTAVVSIRNDGDLLEVTLNDAIANLSGLDLTLACACLTYTVMELTGTHGVRVCAETKSLDGHSSITMDKTNLLLVDLATKPTESAE